MARVSCSFNPVLGFYCPATEHADSGQRYRHGFNPVLGFYCPATSTLSSMVGADGFQSRSGFLLSCDSYRNSPSTMIPSGFQSRSGFLLSCDTRTCSNSAGTRQVSIPFWVSTVLRLPHYAIKVTGGKFQSRSGFLLSCDASRV